MVRKKSPPPYAEEPPDPHAGIVAALQLLLGDKDPDELTIILRRAFAGVLTFLPASKEFLTIFETVDELLETASENTKDGTGMGHLGIKQLHSQIRRSRGAVRAVAGMLGVPLPTRPPFQGVV